MMMLAVWKSVAPPYPDGDLYGISLYASEHFHRAYRARSGISLKICNAYLHGSRGK